MSTTGTTSAPEDVAKGDWWATEVETAEERAFVSLIPSCRCCFAYISEARHRKWAEKLRTAALALTASAPTGPGC